MKPRSWTEITISIPESYQDLLVGQLAALGFEGFLQENHALKCIIQKHKWNSALRTRLNHYIQKFGNEFPSLKLKFFSRTITRQNWNQRWERSVGIVEATRKILITPSWKQFRGQDKGKIVLTIDPKMSFGTGHHETTRLCLQLLEEYVLPGMSVLDFGSGTGILAIAAARLGAKRSVSVDNDEWTILNIKENILRNRVKNSVKVVTGSADSIPKVPFDLIVANVDLPTITRVHPQLLRRMKQGGILMLSGILVSDLLRVHDILRHKGIAPLDVIVENGWAAIAFLRM